MSKLNPKETGALIEMLEAEGYSVDRTPQKERVRTSILRDLAKPGKTIRIGVCSDTHLGSKFQQLTYLRDFYKYADSRGVAAFINAGDIVDGPVQFHRDQPYGNFRHGFDAQVKYAAEVYPRSTIGAETHFIDGNHDRGVVGNALGGGSDCGHAAGLEDPF